jgi:8-oxo-dGTP diphosphatase
MKKDVAVEHNSCKKPGPRLRATLIALDDLGRILLLTHVREHGTYYVLPGGGVDKGETIENALVRELREELGAVCTVERLVAVGEMITPTRHVVDFFYLGILDRHDDFKILYSEGIGSAEWLEVTELDKIVLRPENIIPVLKKVVSGELDHPVYLGKY